MTKFLRTVTLKNFKSIARCRVDLGEVTILVGPCGSGKSNFIDAPRLVSDALRDTLDDALQERGGLAEVRRKSGGHPTDFAIGLQLGLGNDRFASYGFEIGSAVDGGPRVKREEAVIAGPETPVSGHYFKVREGELVDADPDPMAKVRADHLYLETVSAHPVFRALFEPLSRVRFHDFEPAEMRRNQPHDSGRLLRPDGANIASVVGRLARDHPATFARIGTFLHAITAGLQDVDQVSLGPGQTLVFRQRVGAAKYPWPFFAHSMSTGTLRALAVLTAVFQDADDEDLRVPLVGIEEPEAGLHPGALAILAEAVMEASRRVQIVLTTHSPDLLELEGIAGARIQAVRNEAGNSVIRAVDTAAIEAVKQDLHRIGYAPEPPPEETEPKTQRGTVTQGDLFPGKPAMDA